MRRGSAGRQVAPSVLRRCLAPTAFLLVGIWGTSWMSDPAHVPGNIDRVHAALERVHPTEHAPAAGPADPPLTPAERSVLVAGKIGSVADAAIVASVLALLFGILAGAAPRPWLYRLHRWSRFVALCLAVSLMVGSVAELTPRAAIAVIDLLPFILPLAIVAGLVSALVMSRHGTVRAHPAKTVRRRVRRP